MPLGGKSSGRRKEVLAAVSYLPPEGSLWRNEMAKWLKLQTSDELEKYLDVSQVPEIKCVDKVVSHFDEQTGEKTENHVRYIAYGSSTFCTTTEEFDSSEALAERWEFVKTFIMGE